MSSKDFYSVFNEVESNQKWIILCQITRVVKHSLANHRFKFTRLLQNFSWSTGFQRKGQAWNFRVDKYYKLLSLAQNWTPRTIWYVLVKACILLKTLWIKIVGISIGFIPLHALVPLANHLAMRSRPQNITWTRFNCFQLLHLSESTRYSLHWPNLCSQNDRWNSTFVIRLHAYMIETIQMLTSNREIDQVE